MYHISIITIYCASKNRQLYKSIIYIGFIYIYKYNVYQFEEEEKRYLLTSSGIIVVKNLYRDIVITAFMATVAQGYRLYRMAGKGQMSPKMEKKIVKNCERHPELFTIIG